MSAKPATRDTDPVYPTGKCWCGKTVNLGSYFAPGHDVVAIKRVVGKRFGSAASFLLAFGEEPGGTGLPADPTNALAEARSILRDVAAALERSRRP